MTHEILQFCPLPSYLEAGLKARFTVHRWFELPAPDFWLEQHAATISAIVTGANVGVPNAVIAQCSSLSIIAINGVGFDKVDLDFARQLKIRVTYTPGVVTDDVADLALGLTISLLRNLPTADRHVREGLWPKGNLPLARKVSGRHFGVLGLGRIGLAIAARLSALGSVAYYATAPKPCAYRYIPDPIRLALECDVLVIAASANPTTQRMVGRELLNALGPQGFLVNIARGTLVDEPELIAALIEGRIAGAALDVFDDEPNVSPQLRSLSNVVLSPHIGTATVETRENMGKMVLSSLDSFFAGEAIPGVLL
jgi:hydroxypyruvate reductase